MTIAPDVFPPDLAGGESLTIRERLVVAPAQGVFRPRPAETVTTEGELVAAGQPIGTVECSGESVEAESRFAGYLMGFLAAPGERVRAGQPLAWLRLLDAAR